MMLRIRLFMECMNIDQIIIMAMANGYMIKIDTMIPMLPWNVHITT